MNFDILGSDKLHALFILPEFENGQNIRVIESGRGVGFLLETLQMQRVAGKFFGKNLQSHFAIKIYILSQINIAHAARAYFLYDFVLTKLRASIAVSGRIYFCRLVVDLLFNRFEI